MTEEKQAKPVTPHLLRGRGDNCKLISILELHSAFTIFGADE